MRKSNMSGYINVLSKVLQGTEDEAGEMNSDFEKVRAAIDNDTVSDLSQVDLQKIVDNFQRGTDGYEDKLNKLEQASAPVRILGKHKSLVAAFRVYTDACQAMTDSINVEAQTVDVDAFNQSEKTQENAMEKVTAATQRIMTSSM